MKALPVFLLALFFCLPLAAQDAPSASQPDGEVRFISDKLFIYMHSGPSKNYRIIGSVNAGARVTLLDTNSDTGFAHIRDPKGRTGWVESRYLTEQPGLAHQLQELTLSYNEAKAFNEQYQAEIARQRLDISNLEEKLQQTASRNQHLAEQNEKLRQQLQQQDQAQMMSWFIKGGGVALAGVLLGLLMPLLWPKKRRHDRWM